MHIIDPNRYESFSLLLTAVITVLGIREIAKGIDLKWSGSVSLGRLRIIAGVGLLILSLLYFVAIRLAIRSGLGLLFAVAIIVGGLAFGTWVETEEEAAAVNEKSSLLRLFAGRRRRDARSDPPSEQKPRA